MRLFICFILFVLFYGCASDNNNFKRNENLLYQVQWLAENHVKVHFDTLSTIDLGDCYSPHIKFYEIRNDSLWFEIKEYNVQTQKRNWQKSRIFKTDTLKRSDFTEKSLIMTYKPVKRSKSIVNNKSPFSFMTGNTAFDNIPVEEKLQLDSIFITVGSCGIGQTIFTFKNDSISVTKTTKQIGIWKSNNSIFNISIPDTLHLGGAATDFILQKINTAVDITELEAINTYMEITHAPGSQVEIFVGNQNFEANQNVFTPGVSSLIQLASSITKEDLK